MPQKVLDPLSMKLLAGGGIVHGLILKPHAVFDSPRMSSGKRFCPFANSCLERFFWDQRVHYPTAQRFGSALERAKAYASAKL